MELKDPHQSRPSEEESALFDTQRAPYNRRARRKIAKKAGVRFSVVNEKMVKKAPVYLGINKFKKNADPEMKKIYKQNAWKSREELELRRAQERLKAAKKLKKAKKNDSVQTDK